MPVDTIDLAALQQAGVVSHKALGAKVFLSGAIEKKVKLVGIGVTKGAKAAIEARLQLMLMDPNSNPAEKAKINAAMGNLAVASASLVFPV